MDEYANYNRSIEISAIVNPFIIRFILTFIALEVIVSLNSRVKNSVRLSPSTRST